MLIIRSYFITGLFIIFITQVQAVEPPVGCNCIWEGGFLESYSKADLVVSGKITRYKGNSMDFNIEKKWTEKPTGRTFLPNIRIWTAYPNTCRPNINAFKTQQDWVFALYKIDKVPSHGFNPNTPNQSYGRSQDYYLSACGSYWLKLNEGVVSGNLNSKTRWEYQDELMNPVLESLLIQYVTGKINKATINKAAVSQHDDIKDLMNKTKGFLYQ